MNWAIYICQTVGRKHLLNMNTIEQLPIYAALLAAQIRTNILFTPPRMGRISGLKS